jgi:single-strand DNA-binding protein
LVSDPVRKPMASPARGGIVSAGYNQTVLLGRLCSPPEKLKTKGGKLFIKAVIAVSVHRKSADGIGEEHTSFIPATMFGKTAELFRKYVAKGDMVHLAGHLDASEWKTQDGSKRLNLSFVVDQLNLLPNERKATAPPAKKQSQSEPKQLPIGAAPERPLRFNEFGEPDDIPF